MSFRTKAAYGAPPVSRKGLDVAGSAVRAQSLHRQGQVAEAQAVYEKILKKRPNHFEALYMLGVCERQNGNFEAAVRLFRRALMIDPRSAEVHSELGLTLEELQQHDQALTCFDKLIELKPDFAEAHYNRANVLLASGRPDQAIASFDRATLIDPNHFRAWNNRGNALLQLGKFEQCFASYSKALTLNPAHVSALINRGTTLLQLKQPQQAMTDFDRALALAPDQVVAWTNRGEALRVLRRMVDAIASCDKALSISPDLAHAWLVRASILKDVGLETDALAAYKRALALNPNFSEALTRLGELLALQGDAEAAVSCFDRSLAIKPDDESTLSSRIFSLDFIADGDFASHQAARSLWWDRIGAKIAAEHPSRHHNEFNPNKRIVLGYVSADFRDHSAAYAFRPVLQRHDRSQFEVICYCGSPVEDTVTASFRQLADRWRDVRLWSDDQLAQCIRSDKVDILIDLSGHTDKNRLGAFARKPAPLQVTAWGHATGTGQKTIDYLFSDPVMVPAEVRHLFAEQIYDLPCATIIEPPPAKFRCCEPPVTSNGYLTYGVFNRVGKISNAAIDVWARILRSDLTARLMIKDVGIDIDAVRSTLLDKFASHGIVQDRLQLLGSTSRDDHLAAYRQVDMCLDPFPQGGGVSTWEALHMGVPVVAKIGNAIPQRLGGAILSAIGLTDWVATDDDQYVEIALRSTPERLRTLRRELPDRIDARCGPAAYTQAVEEAYQAIWKKRCGSQSPPAQSDLGMALKALQRHVEATACFDSAIALKPDFADAYYNKANLLMELGRFADAVAGFDMTISINPDHVSAWNNRGNALLPLGQCEQAIASYSRALTLKPTHVGALINRGTTHLRLKQEQQAVNDFDRALALAPDETVAWTNRGEALRLLQRLEDASASCDKALSISPDHAPAWLIRACIMTDLGSRTEAIEACERALGINPKFPEALTKLGECLVRRGDLEAAASCFDRSLAIKPDDEITLTKLGECLAGQNDAEAAVSCFDRSLTIKPDDEITLSSRIFALDFVANGDFASHQAARSLWWDRIGAKIAAEHPSRHHNEFNPNKRIVLGYVSADFRHHSAAYAFWPVLQRHDRSQFEVICYCASPAEDAVTASFRQLADRWRDVRLWSDDQLVQCIRTDQVDILIDLSGHTDGNRLRAFARKPAPIQITAWGHATGTGQKTIDYLFSDPVMVPAEVRHLFAEQIYDLPCATIIEPPPAEFISSEPPVTSNGYMTYGVFNRVSKISNASIAIWARILRSDLSARLMIKHFGIDIDAVRSVLLDKFASHGIAQDRLQLIGSTSRKDHLAAYRQVDIGLDPFPQGGGVSTWEALHMGVPVVAKIGNAIPQRLGGAILSAIGQTDWVATDDDHYVDIALRSTPDRLRTLRRELPDLINTRCSPVAYTRAVEAAYQAMWKKRSGEVQR
jgi:predicted O-linked N-acetylglucosamine transferase (SPINDLY family)